MEKRILFILVTIILSCKNINEPSNTVNTGTENVPAGAKTDMEASSRFEDMKFGFMIHWGPAVLHGKTISWSMPEVGGRAKYESYYKQFNPQKFNAEEWISVAEMIGAKYAVLVCKHHDGYCLWDTKTTDANVMNSPLKRDVVGEFVAACRNKDIAVGTYLSIMDVHEDKWEQVYGSQSDMPGYPEGIPHILDFTTRQSLELIRKYNPDIMWYDGQWLEGWNKDIARTLYDRLKKEKPDMLITRIQSRPPLSGDGSWDYENNVGDYHSMEHKIGGYMKTPWEVVTSIGVHHYSHASNHEFFTAKQVVDKLVRVWCGNGNLLLNFIPDAEGEIDETQKKLAKEIGAWVKDNSDAIYGTRGGPWYPNQWGGSTRKGKKIYVYALPEAPRLIRLSACPTKVLGARILSNGIAIEYKQSDEGLDLKLPESVRDPKATVIELTVEEEIKGMLDHRKESSIFADDTYGKIISENAQLTLSTISPQDNEENHKYLFTDAQDKMDYAFHTESEARPWALIDLQKIKKLTGFAIENSTSLGGRAETLRVYISKDKKEWEQVWAVKGLQWRWEVPLTDFHDAGGKLPGKLARYVKLETIHDWVPQPLHLRKVEIYGHEVEE